MAEWVYRGSGLVDGTAGSPPVVRGAAYPRPPQIIYPPTIAETEEAMDALRWSLKQIDAQLADPDRLDPVTGGRLSGHAYWTWRHRAIAAKGYKERELRALRGHLMRLRDACYADEATRLSDYTVAARFCLYRDELRRRGFVPNAEGTPRVIVGQDDQEGA